MFKKLDFQGGVFAAPLDFLSYKLKGDEDTGYVPVVRLYGKSSHISSKISANPDQMVITQIIAAYEKEHAIELCQCHFDGYARQLLGELLSDETLNKLIS